MEVPDCDSGRIDWISIFTSSILGRRLLLTYQLSAESTLEEYPTEKRIAVS